MRAFWGEVAGGAGPGGGCSLESDLTEISQGFSMHAPYVEENLRKLSIGASHAEIGVDNRVGLAGKDPCPDRMQAEHHLKSHGSKREFLSTRSESWRITHDRTCKAEYLGSKGKVMVVLKIGMCHGVVGYDVKQISGQPVYAHATIQSDPGRSDD